MEIQVTVIITSAVVAALVSGGFLMWNAHLDRKARKSDLLFKTAFEVAHERTKLAWEIARDTKTPANFLDTIYVAEDYYEWVKHFYETGRLPKDAQENLKKAQEKLGL